ncbi:MAG: hypothetical protein P8X74_15880, partial [Reinekea sp.]
WEEISMDFIVGLPKTQSGYDSIWVIVENRLGDIPNFVPRIKNMDFINFIREQLPPDTDKKEYPCAYKLTDELILTYAIDNDEAFIHVSPAMLEQYEISAEQMRDIGERNCVEILRDLHVKSQDGYYRLFAPEHMTACSFTARRMMRSRVKP